MLRRLVEQYVYGDFVELLVSFEDQYVLTCSDGKRQAPLDCGFDGIRVSRGSVNDW